MHVVYGFIAGVFAGGALSYLYARKVIAEYRKVLGIGDRVRKAL